MFRSLMIAAVTSCCILGAATDSHAGGFKVKVKSLGGYQQKKLAQGFGMGVGKGVEYATTPYLGPNGGKVAGDYVGGKAGNHAQKKWTGKGLKNWNKPKHW